VTSTLAVDLPSPARVGGLLAAARPLPAGWERGVQFNGSTCLPPAPWPYCPADESPGPEPKQANAPSSVAVFEPTGIFQAVECTTKSRERAGELASEALAATADFQLGFELANGAVTGNPSFADATTTTAPDVLTALADLESGIASGLYGRLAFIHVSPGMLVYLTDACRGVHRDGRAWRSPMGNLIVASPGYVDLGSTLVATGEVYAETSVPETRVDIDRAVNQTVAYGEQVGLAAFDPCFNIAVEVTS